MQWGKQEERLCMLMPLSYKQRGINKGESKILQIFDHIDLSCENCWRDVRLEVGETSQKTIAKERRKLETR